MQPDLLRERLDALALVTASFGRAVVAGDWREIELTPDDVSAWLGVLNDVRLVLGTRLGVTEERAPRGRRRPELRRATPSTTGSPTSRAS